MRTSKVVALAVAAGLGIGGAAALPATAATQPAAQKHAAGCRLDANNPGLKHVIYLQFDNVHFTRDNPNVPSDLEQMPHLLNFLTSNGVVDTNHHTPLIAHTGNDILTSLTGLYGDRHGQAIANSYRYFNPDGSTNSAASFAYWTDGVADSSVPTPSDSSYTMVTPQGKNTPAPWVSYTRAGCDYGAVSVANTVLENTTVDINKVFGATSPQAAEAKADPGKATTDYVGIGLHCAKSSALCKGAGANASPDLLPDEPGGYNGYQALFGAKAVDPAISTSGVVDSTDGTPITDGKGNPGFPGFDGMSAANSLGYVAQMQESGVPVTFAYISDAHDRHAAPYGAFGPGEAGYVAQLKTYDNAFGAFFSRLAKDGITTRNTDFVVTSDENDHFVGGAPTPANCDGVTVPCTYAQVGEINANANGLLATQQGVTTPFKLHSDSAPNFYVTGNPAQTDPKTRSLEQAWAKVTAVNPITGKTDTVNKYLADQTEMKLLHMVTGDAARTPTFTSFADPNYYVYGAAANCNSACVALGPAYAWNHGDFSSDINTTWLGLAGPGVKHLGITDKVWSDHTDIRPTLLALTGLRSDYRGDGVVLTGFLDDKALHGTLRGSEHQYAQLAAAYKQLDAGVGAFAAATLQLSNAGVSSASTGDATYLADEATLTALGTERDALAAQIAGVLNGAATGHHRIDDRTADRLVKAAHLLVQQAQQAAA
ncbi:hypothetical protein [Streptacidiphilus jiangxiensis]|uniref:Type I phosphodiesterase / nucleotide pyrophosphatase n=1 Tax=Streptacidiphilus jiangxiensis TaxID=235985 RepID=A0A1H8A838_STRJI|nr:hypothetical protein [Streptacidiphilus jiangxiensis]SEM66850.1 hypothetical protein SAMN05414137_1425 [Streptacidiphilus jiangxiensis]